MIIKIVVITKNKFVLKPKFEDAKTLGINKKIMNGLSIPPVKYIKAPSCRISINKKINADLSDSCVFL